MHIDKGTIWIADVANHTVKVHVLLYVYLHSFEPYSKGIMFHIFGIFESSSCLILQGLLLGKPTPLARALSRLIKFHTMKGAFNQSSFT